MHKRQLARRMFEGTSQPRVQLKSREKPERFSSNWVSVATGGRQGLQPPQCPAEPLVFEIKQRTYRQSDQRSLIFRFRKPGIEEERRVAVVVTRECRPS